jgi:hypothetical protein
VEPHFHDDSYGYRPGKSALEGVVCSIVRSSILAFEFCSSIQSDVDTPNQLKLHYAGPEIG